MKIKYHNVLTDSLNNCSLDVNRIYHSFSQRMTQLSSYSQGSLENKIFHNAQVKSVKEISPVTQVRCQ